VNGDTEFCFTVPYLQDVPFLNVARNKVPSYNQGYSNGSFGVFLVSDIVTTDPSANSTITVLVYAAGAADMDFKRPVGSGLLPIFVPSAFVKKSLTDLTKRPLQKRSLIKDGKEEKKPSTLYSQASLDVPREYFMTGSFPPLVDADAIIYEDVSFGESTVRMSSLITRFQELSHITTTLALGTLVENYNLWQEIGINPTAMSPTMRRVLSTFGYNKGSTRYGLSITSGTDNLRVYSTNYDPLVSPVPSSTNFITFNEGTVITDYITKQIPLVEVPFYAPQLCRSHFTGYQSPEGVQFTIKSTNNLSTDLINATVFGAVGEDFVLAYPLAPVPENIPTV